MKMGRLSIAFFVVIFVLLCLHLQSGQASRVLHGQDKEWKQKAHVLLQALPKGSVDPSDPSGCTYIPGTGGTGCPINQKNFAGGDLSRAATSGAYPQPSNVRFGVASNGK